MRTIEIIDGYEVTTYGSGHVVRIPVQPTPLPKFLTILTVLAFRNRFTFTEKVAIKQSTDPGVQVIQDDLSVAQDIDLENQNLIDGMAYMVSQGLLTQARCDEILTAEIV